MLGKVQFFNNVKGWGFITGDDGIQYFVHYKNIACDGYKRLEDGQRVEFKTAVGAKGMDAVAVTVVG